MAKIKAPLFSLDAAGTLDKNITYKKKLQDNIAQKYSQPGSKNPFESSPRQKDQRSIIRLITIHWQCMPNLEKLDWDNAAKTARFKGTGYHYFLHMAQQDLTKYLGLVGYWSMNYNVGDKIPDLSGNGNHGILSPIYPCDCPTLVDSFDKKHGKALCSNGASNYLNILQSSSLTLNDTDGLTYIMWFKTLSDLPSINYSNVWLSHYIYNTKGVYLQAHLGKPRFILNGSDSVFEILGTHSMQKNTFYHLSFTQQNGYSSIFFNGLIDTNKPTIQMGTTSNVPLRLARNSSYMDCIIDDFTVFNRPLTHEEIYKIFTLTF